MPLSARHSRNRVMGEINNLASPPGRPERKYRRFLATHPVELKIFIEDTVSELQAITQNVSVGGFLLVTASPVPQHCLVDFIMTLHGGHLIRPIRVVGQGQVVRVEPLQPSAGFAVAIKCNREIEHHLLPFAG